MSPRLPICRSLARALVGLVGAVLVLLVLVAVSGPVRAADCAGLDEAGFRQQALASSDIALSRRYLACYPYGDGAVSVRRHEATLRKGADCERILKADDIVQLRLYVAANPDSACIQDVLARLKALQQVPQYHLYGNAGFVGVQLAQGTVADKESCVRGCANRGPACAGYTFDGAGSVCTLWKSIESRTVRGNAFSGSLAEVAPPSLQTPPPPASPPPGQITLLPQTDLPNDTNPAADYRNVPAGTIRECSNACETDTFCRAFTYNTSANRCFLKTSYEGKAFHMFAISGVKGFETPATRPAIPPENTLPPPSQPTAGEPMRILDNVDLPNPPGDPADYSMFRDIDLDQCSSACQADQRCVGFTYNQKSRACFLKSAFSRAAAFMGATSGLKQGAEPTRPAPPVEPPPVYRQDSRPLRTYSNIDLSNRDDPSADYANIPGMTLLACNNACRFDARCVAFTYNSAKSVCFLKSSFIERRVFNGAVSGIKMQQE